jgi:hypothetical protein
LKLFQEWGEGIKENDHRWGEFKHDIADTLSELW